MSSSKQWSRKTLCGVFYDRSFRSPITLKSAFEPIADESPAAVAFQFAGNNDLTETFAAIGRLDTKRTLG